MSNGRNHVLSVVVQMTEHFEVVGNLKFYEISSMICAGNSSQDHPLNALVSDQKGTIFIPESVDFLGDKRKVELIGNSSFSGCHASSVYIPRFIKEIRRDAFIYCPLLKKIIFTENSELYFIGRGAIHLIPKLTHIYLPSSVEYIQKQALSSNTLSMIYYCGSAQITEDVFWQSKITITNRKVYVTDQYPLSKFGEYDVEEKKISCFADFYPKKCCTIGRKQTFNINVIFITSLLI